MVTNDTLESAVNPWLGHVTVHGDEIVKTAAVNIVWMPDCVPVVARDDPPFVAESWTALAA